MVSAWVRWEPADGVGDCRRDLLWSQFEIRLRKEVPDHEEQRDKAFRNSGRHRRRIYKGWFGRYILRQSHSHSISCVSDSGGLVLKEKSYPPLWILFVLLVPT